jgi:cytochrome c-type biogenesis protein CcmE
VAQPFSRKIVIAVSVILVGFAILFGVGLKGSLVYYLTVSEFLDTGRRDDLGDHFRVNGNVVTDSIERTPGAPGARFLMSDGKRQLPVAYGKETPDTFVDGSEVVVEGSLGADGTFVATTLLAKCPSKYEAQNRSPSDYKAPETEDRPSPDSLETGPAVR